MKIFLKGEMEIEGGKKLGGGRSTLSFTRLSCAR